MATYTDPRWISLAHSAAQALGANTPPIVAAILAQWSCEDGTSAPWPPALNNPGNLTSNIGGLDGEPHSVGRYIGGGDYLYRYQTPLAGALAYANYLLHSSRYRTAITAARAGDAKGFLTAVCNGGYGTRLTCCLAILPHIAAVPTPQPAQQHWRCIAGTVNVRQLASTGGKIVGTQHRGDVVAGPVVAGGRYVVNGRAYNSWLHIGNGRYTARVFYVAI